MRRQINLEKRKGTAFLCWLQPAQINKAVCEGDCGEVTCHASAIHRSLQRRQRRPQSSSPSPTRTSNACIPAPITMSHAAQSIGAQSSDRVEVLRAHTGRRSSELRLEGGAQRSSLTRISPNRHSGRPPPSAERGGTSGHTQPIYQEPSETQAPPLRTVHSSPSHIQYRGALSPGRQTAHQ